MSPKKRGKQKKKFGKKSKRKNLGKISKEVKLKTNIKYKKKSKQNIEIKKNEAKVKNKKKSKNKEKIESKENKENNNKNEKIDFKIPKTETTFANHLVRLLPSISLAPSNKKTPSNLQECFELSNELRAILFQQFFEKIEAKYNKSLYQYACQCQRLFRKYDQKKI